MLNYRQVGCRQISAISMLAAVPYLLLSASQDVRLTTVVNWDGSGGREYVVSYEPGRADEVHDWLREHTSGRARQSRPRSEGPVLTINRSWREANAEKLADQAQPSLRMAGIIENPLSIWTYYRWSEELEIYRDRATEVETLGAQKALLHYQLKMPGRVLPDTVSAKGKAQGDTVTWELSGDADQYTLAATSRRVRWGYLLFLVYVVGFIAFQVVHYTAQAIRNRPRKI